jgi:hypothetical protein
MTLSNSTSKLEYYFDTIESCEQIGEFEDEYVYDIEVADDTHTFIANDILVHNSTYARGDLILESLGIDIEKYSHRELTACLQYIYNNKMNKLFADTLEATISKRHGENVMDFEFELIGGHAIFVEKKKYIMTTLIYDNEYVGHKGWFKSTGIEIQQSGSSKKVHDVLKAFINIIFTKWHSMDDRTFFGLCASAKSKLMTANIDDLAKINRVKTYDEYVINDKEKLEFKPKVGAPVKGAARYNQLIWKNKLQNKYPYIKNGMRVKWYYDANGEAFSYPDDVYPKEIMPDMDASIQLDKLVFAPLKRLVTGLFKADMKQMGSNEIQRGFRVLKNHS